MKGKKEPTSACMHESLICFYCMDDVSKRCVCVCECGDHERDRKCASVCVGACECVMALPLGVYNKRQQAGQTLSSAKHQPDLTNLPINH